MCTEGCCHILSGGSMYLQILNKIQTGIRSVIERDLASRT